MKHILSLVFCILLFVTTNGQSSYPEAMQEGDEAFKKGDYKKAIAKYFAAEAFDPIKKNVVKDSVNKVFYAIDALRIKAVNDEKQLRIANTKAQKLIDAFYFYADRFALAFKDGKFYFIDKNGDEAKLGKWEKAEQFDERGFAKVKVKENDVLHSFLIDTSGNRYKLAYNIKDIDSSIEALDLSEQSLEQIPPELFIRKGLKVLILGNVLDSLPEEIGQLANLTTLDLSGSEQINSLPKEIGSLKKLTSLNLNGTPLLESLPKEIMELKQLTTLRLTQNHSGSEADSLLKNIWGLKNLTTLDLNWDQLNTLPSEIGKLANLTTLNLSGCQLYNLPKEIGKLKKLINLDLSFNYLDSLPKEIWGLTNLRTLNLYGNKKDKNKFFMTESEIRQIKTQLPNCKIITGIDPDENDDDD